MSTREPAADRTAEAPRTAPGNASSGAVPERLRTRRHRLVVALAFATGAADATGFLALGGAFASVMTGNMVLLGLGAGQADLDLVVNAGVAIVSFAIGVLVGASLAGAPRPDDGVWPGRVSVALAVELALWAALLGIWIPTRGEETELVALGLLGLAACAMGIQSSAVQRFGVPGLSSTYLTGTLTTLIGGIAARKPRRVLVPSALVLLALVTGAAAGGVIATHLRVVAPAVVIVVLVGVLALGERLRRVHVAP